MHASFARLSHGLLLGGLIAGVVHAAPAVPDPPSSPVTDRAGVLSPDIRDSLARRLTRYEAQSGHQIVVWIDRTTGGVPIEDFAVSAFERWKIGRAGLDDGLALFAMTEDRALRIEVGYGLEPTVTDMATATVIRDTMIPRIHLGEWDAAIVGGVEQLVDVIEGRPNALSNGDDGRVDGGEPAAPSPQDSLLGRIVGLVFLGFMVFLLITNPQRALMLLVLLGRGGGGFRGGGGYGGGGFRGGGGRSGGGGASGSW